MYWWFSGSLGGCTHVESGDFGENEAAHEGCCRRASCLNVFHSNTRGDVQMRVGHLWIPVLNAPLEEKTTEIYGFYRPSGNLSHNLSYEHLNLKILGVPSYF